MSKTEMNVIATVELVLFVDESLSYGVYSGETTQDKLKEEVAWLLSNSDYVQMEVTKVNVVGP